MACTRFAAFQSGCTSLMCFGNKVESVRIRNRWIMFRIELGSLLYCVLCGFEFRVVRSEFERHQRAMTNFFWVEVLQFTNTAAQLTMSKSANAGENRRSLRELVG